MTSPRGSTSVSHRSSWLRTVFIAGLVIGITDYAIGFGIFAGALGRPVLGVFQAPAAAVLGIGAFRGGLITAGFGLILHFVISFVWAAAFAILYRQSPRLRRIVSQVPGLILIGAAAGVIIWLVMNNVLAPLGRGRPEPFGTNVFWAVLVGHVIFVGIPLVWATRNFAPDAKRVERTAQPATIS